MSAQFDLSILTSLQDNFTALEGKIRNTDESINQHEASLLTIQEQMEKLESQKLNIEIQLGTIREERLKLNTLYESAKTEHEKVKQCATHLLEILADKE